MAFEFHETFNLTLPSVDDQLSRFSEAEFSESHGLITEIWAIHEGSTKNYNFYSADELKQSLESWVQPYLKPVIINHDLTSEPLGRIVGAKMGTEADGTPVQILQAAITDPKSIEKVRRKEFLTGSVGGRSEEAVCSICKTNWAAPRESARGLPCKHQRGKVYNGKVAMMEMRGISFHEYSFVNLPADSKSGIRGVVESDGMDFSDDWDRSVRFFVLDMHREGVVELTESAEVDVLADMKKKDATSMHMAMKGAFIETQVMDKIRPEKYESEKVVKSYQTLTSNDELVETDLEENVMADEELTSSEESDDILSVSEELMSDTPQAEEASSETEETEVVTEESEEVSEEEVTEEAPEVTEETSEVSEEETEHTAETEVEEGEQDSGEEVEPEISESEEEVSEETETEEPSAVTEEETVEEEAESIEEDESGEKSELSEVEETAESHDERDEKIQALEEENQRLRKALHRMLVERVVDAKIATGSVKSDDRSEAIAEHESRTASSLADTLRDLQTMAPSLVIAPKMNEESAVVIDDADGSSSIEEGAESEEAADPMGTAEDFFSDILMGRKKILSN